MEATSNATSSAWMRSTLIAIGVLLLLIVTLLFFLVLRPSDSGSPQTGGSQSTPPTPTAGVPASPAPTAPTTIAVDSEADSLAMSPDGRTLYVGRRDNTIGVFDTATGAELASVPVSGQFGGMDLGTYPDALALSPDGSRLYVGNIADGAGNYLSGNTVVVIDTSSNSVVDAKRVASAPGALAVSPGGDQIFVWTLTCTLDVLSTSPAAPNPVSSLTFSGLTQTFCGSMTVDAVAERAYLVANRSVLDINIATSPPTLIRSIPVGDDVGSVVVDGRGTLYAVSDNTDTIVAVDLATGALRAPIQAGYSHIVLNAEGTIAYSNSSTDYVEVANLLDRCVVGHIPVGQGLGDLVLSPSGDRLYIAMGIDTVAEIKLPASQYDEPGCAAPPVAAPSATPSPDIAAGPLAAVKALDPLLLIGGALGLLLITVIVWLLIAVARRPRGGN